METILGIDLGTTNSVVSIIRNDDVEVLREQGEAILPSVVGVDQQGELIVGAAARNQAIAAPDRTVRSIKRLMGQAKTVRLGAKEYSPQEISSFILKELKCRAERQLGGAVSKAVITVPAFFDENQREATRQSGELAGLDVVRIINEPTAASLTYPADPNGPEKLLVYDLGGGTFDVSLVTHEGGVVEVVSSHGDVELGGDDFDELLMEYVCERFNDEHGVDLQESMVARSRLRQAVENAKIHLSSHPFVTIEEEFIAEVDGNPLHLQMEISREEYEDLIEPLLLKTLDCVDRAMSDASWSAEQISKVILVGGSSRTPLVHELLQDRLSRPMHFEVDPDLCVSMGAAIQGGMIAGRKIGPVLVDITAHTLGISCISMLFGVMSPHCFAPIIDRGSSLPIRRSKIFYTSYDGQEKVDIECYQGEDPDARNNRAIGSFTIEGLADVAQGNQIEVEFELDLNGILSAKAIERATSLAKQVTFDRVGVVRSDKIDAGDASEEVVHKAELVGVASPNGGGSNLSAEASALVRKANALAPQVHDEDAAELKELIRKVEANHNDDDIAALEDLVFYLDDNR